MPQIFKIGSYWVFFWANESDPPGTYPRVRGCAQR